MAQVTKGRQFVSGETVTPAKLNELVDNATVTSIVDADVSASAAIALSKLATGALPTAITVASANLVDGTIVNADINSSAAIAGSKLADASVTPAKLSQPYTLATAQASTSGTNVDFTGIPSWAKRITVMLDGVSLSGTSNILVQLGDSGGFENSGYAASAHMQTNVLITSTQGFILNASGTSAAMTRRGHVFLTNISGNAWVMSGLIQQDGGGQSSFVSSCAGAKSLSAALTQVRITTANGTDTFDAGTINIAYEG